MVGVMAKRKENHYNNNVIIDNKVVSVSDLQTSAKSASMRFFALVLGITLLASMVVPYLSMAAAATSTSNAFNGTVIPGYSMGGLELTAYGVSINSWGQVDTPTFVKSNYGIWNQSNIPKNADEVADTFNKVDDLSNINDSDKASGWKQLIGATNHTNNNPNGSKSYSQNEKSDAVSPIRTKLDSDYWNKKDPVSNSTNNATITASLYPDFIVVSKDENNKAHIISSPTQTNDSIMNFNKENKYTTSKPIYISLSDLMEKYKSDLQDTSNTMDDLFHAIANNRTPLDDLVNDESKDLLQSTSYEDLNSGKNNISSDAFNPYPYTMVFSMADSQLNTTVVSSIYENCEAYVYFSPTVAYQKYQQIKNEYNAIVNSASEELNQKEQDAVTVVQLGYYSAAMAILEAYLEEALPQDMTRGYVGMTETDSSIRGASDGSEVGQGGTRKFSSAKDLQKITYATLMYDVAISIPNSDGDKYDLNYTNAIMDSLSVFGYGANHKMKAGVMKGLTRDENYNRRTNLTALESENYDAEEANQSKKDEAWEQFQAAVKEVKKKNNGKISAEKKQELREQIYEPVKAEIKKKKQETKDNGQSDGTDTKNAGMYTPVYYPIQQHKMPDNEKQYRFSVLANIPYNTFIQYISKNTSFANVSLTYSSNFTSSFTQVTDLFANGKHVSKISQLVDQYNKDNEDTGINLSDVQINQLISVNPDVANDSDSSSSSTSNENDGDNALNDTTEENATTRVDNALIGYSSGNMTSDNVHDMVDIVRAAPNIKQETFYRFFNPLKSDGSDQDIFVTRITPATTTYFPSLLINGYENAGGSEVNSNNSTHGVSFDYFSIPSFAPCFASHTASDTYYGALNYELRAFYKKGFIGTLSDKTNLPQVGAMLDAQKKADGEIKKTVENSSIDAETMKSNLKTIFVEAKRYAAGQALIKLQSLGKHSTGTIPVSIVRSFYGRIFQDNFNYNFSREANENDNHFIGDKDSKETIKNTQFLGNTNENEGDNKTKAKKGKYYFPETVTVDKDKNMWVWKDTVKSYKDLNSSKEATTNKKTKKIVGFYWQPFTNEKTEVFGGNGFSLSNVTGDEVSTIFKLENPKDGDKHDSSFAIGTAIAGWDNDKNLSCVMVPYDNTYHLMGPVYRSPDNINPVISYYILSEYKKVFLDKDSDYYWADYQELEKINANIKVDKGGIAKDPKDESKTEANCLQVVGYAPKWLGDDASAEVTSDEYLKKAKKALDASCAELFKDLVNQNKDLQLIQNSMPSQMQNCLAWADYQNASDSEAQYQSDPSDTVDINIGKKSSDKDYEKANTITGLKSLQNAGFDYTIENGVTGSKSITGATNNAIQARMIRGVEGSTWTSSGQPACYTMSATIARIDNMSSSGVTYPYQNICTGRLKSGTDQYAILQAHVIDYSSIASGIAGDLQNRTHGQVIAITNPNYGALPDFMNILGTVGGIIAEAASGFANLTGGMFEDVMWNGNKESATKVATSDNQTNDDGTIDTSKYNGTGNIERKGSMWVLDSTGGQNFYTLVQSLALVLVLVSLLYIAFKNFYEYTRPAGASASVGEKDEAGKKSAAAESKILAATQLKVVMPRAIIAVFMIGLPPMSGAGFQGGNFLLLQMLSSIFNQISHVFMNLNGQSVMNLWLNTGADLLSENPNIGEYIAYALAMFVIGAMFVVGTIAVLLTDVMLISFYIIGPIMWALYVWPYNDTTSKPRNPDGIIARLTSRMKLAWSKGRVGNKAPEGMIECYCSTAMLNVMWSVIFWAVTIVFTGVTGTIATDTSSTPGNTATLAGAATVSNAAYAQSALMSTGNYYASASVAHADGLFNTGILPMPAWVRMLIATVLAVVVFMLMIQMASGMFKKALGNTFTAVSAVGGAIRGGAIGGALGRAAQLAKGGTNIAAMAGNAKNIADRARNAADNFHKASVRGKLHQIGNAGRSLGSHGANALRRAGQAVNTAGQYVSGDKNLTDGFTNAVRGINNHLNEGAAVNQKDNLKRLNGARESINKLQEAIGANDLDRAQAILDTMTPEEKRLAAHYAPSLFERNRGGHDLRLRAGVTNHDFDRARRELDDRIEIAEARADRHVRNSNNALTPAQVRERNLAAAGIDDLSALTNTLLSADSNDRTKRAARRQLNEYSRRAFGKDIDWDKDGDRKAVNKLLDRDRKVPTADDRAERISDAISDAAATGNKAISSFATRNQIGAYEGDAPQVITRELGRASRAIADSLPSVTAAASDISGIRTTVDTQLSTIAEVYKNRGYTDIEANTRALDVLEGHFGGIDAERARFLSSEITNGGEISNGDAIRLALFNQRYNLGESTVGDKIVESGAGFKTARYVSNLSKVPKRYLNSGAQAAIADMNIQQAYEDYVNSYPISSDAYRASYEHMLDNFPAGRERREMRNIMQNSPFNALFASGRDITRNDIDTLIESADRSGHPIDPKAISAMETMYSEVRQQAVENDATFKDNLLASLPADSSYSSADDAINALDGRQIDTNALTAEVRNSVNDQLTRAQGAFDAATNRISTLTTEIGNTKSQLRHAGRELKDAKKRGDTGEMTRWNDEIRRLKGQLGIQNTELGTETSNQRIAQKSVADIQGYLDSITAVNQAPNPLSPTGRDDN